MANTEDLAFAPNYAHVIELDTTPGGPERTWEYAMFGIKSCKPESDETTEDDEYYHALGEKQTTVQSVKVAIAMEGSRYYGNACQDFIQSLALKTGQDRETNYRWTMPDGTVLTGTCTLTGLVPGSAMGDANAKGEFSYTININTVNELEKPDAALAPTKVEASAVSVAKGESGKVEVTVSPTGANQKCHFGIEDPSICSIDADGNVTGLKAGKTKVTAKAAAKPSVSATFEVTVTAAQAKSQQAAQQS